MNNSPSKNNFPLQTFSNMTSSPQDFQRINMTKNGCSFYQLNGGGRDTYIFNNNGGFCQMKETTKYGRPGNMLHKNNRSKERFP